MKDQKENREKALEIVSKTPYEVVKGNPIINAKYDMSAIQAKIFLHMISKLDVTQPDFEQITIPVQDFAKFANIQSKDIYKIVREESKKLMDKKITYEDDKITLDSVLVASIEYNKRHGTYTFEFSKKLAPFLLQLRGDFTRYNMYNVLTLESSYSIRFFEFCKQYERFNKFEFSVEELKATFGLSDRYKNYFDFKKNVILQAEKELKENCELYFTYKERKISKKIVAITFFVHKNDKKFKRAGGDLEQSEKIPGDDKVVEIYAMVEEFVSKSVVEKWLKVYPLEQIKAGVLYSLQEYKAGRVKSMPKYLQAMVKTPSLFYDQQKILEEQEVKKNQKKEEEQHRSAQKAIEDEKKALQYEVYDLFNQFILRKLQAGGNMHADILNKLRELKEKEGHSFLIQLAFDNYKSISGIAQNSLEEFVGNYQQGGSFQTFVYDYFKELYKQDYAAIKKPFIKRATELNINID